MWYSFVTCVSKLYKPKSYYISGVTLRYFLLLFVDCCELHSNRDHVCHLEWIRNFYFGPSILLRFQSIAQLFIPDWISSNSNRCYSRKCEYNVTQIDRKNLLIHSVRIEKKPCMKTGRYQFIFLFKNLTLYRNDIFAYF